MRLFDCYVAGAVGDGTADGGGGVGVAVDIIIVVCRAYSLRTSESAYQHACWIVRHIAKWPKASDDESTTAVGCRR